MLGYLRDQQTFYLRCPCLYIQRSCDFARLWACFMPNSTANLSIRALKRGPKSSLFSCIHRNTFGDRVPSNATVYCPVYEWVDFERFLAESWNNFRKLDLPLQNKYLFTCGYFIAAHKSRGFSLSNPMPWLELVKPRSRGYELVQLKFLSLMDRPWA